MANIFPVPLYRFFSKKSHLDEMVNEGKLFFNTIHAFTKLDNANFRDENENIYQFKIFKELKHEVDGQIMKGGDTLYRHRKISDAWAVCFSSSNCSDAIKDYCVTVINFGRLLNLIEQAVNNYFNKDVLVMFGPVSYVSDKRDCFPPVPNTPYFTKNDKYKGDLEFRIVIVPPNDFPVEAIQPFTLTLPNPEDIFKDVWVLQENDKP
jgi:hypothetical protein